MKKVTVKIEVKKLLQYREFDRVAKPAPKIPFVQSYSMPEVIQWVAANGIEQPLELSVFGSSALLTDGNHRLAAADHLGIKEVPVDVVYYDSFEQLSAAFYQHTIDRFKPFERL